MAALALVAAPLHGGGSLADTARQLRENGFDRNECYRVRDLTFTKEDIRLYLTDGYLIFSKPILGQPVAAVFTADVEGGDGEVILLPPDRAERRSLAAFIDAPNLDEHIRAAVLLFSGGVYERLKRQMAENPSNRKVPEMGPVLDEKWSPVLRNFGNSYQARLTLDLMSPGIRPEGLFVALVQGNKLGNFDVLYDPEAAEQILAGQVSTRNNRTFFDTWTSFPARSARKNPAARAPDLQLADYRIDATVAPDFALNAITRVKVRMTGDPRPVVSFDVAAEMNVTAVTVDGAPAEVLQGESLRLNLTRAGNNLFLVAPAVSLEPGRDYEFEFHHTGRVIFDAGENVFYVGARSNWYPASGQRFSSYDLTFHFPAALDLVSVGDVVEDRMDGETRTVRRKTSAPIRFASFNLGDYEHVKLERNGYSVDVCANRKAEAALQPRQPAQEPPQLPSVVAPSLRHRPEMPQAVERADPIVTRAPDPTENLRKLADSVAAAMEFMGALFGPPALPHLTVSPIPGVFGQGFPGLIYLSTLAYFKSPPGVKPGASNELFFEDVLLAHETAHQWWGNRVMAATYRDNWLMEALANYSALLFLEKKRGRHAMETMLESYRDQLLAKNPAGQVVESAGPIVLGTRLATAQEPRGWHTITYGKGSWIIQMLRGRMGDPQFFAMLMELSKRYDRKTITTEEFRKLAAEFLPPKSDDPELESFFGQWVYSTGIPELKLTYTVKGKAPNLRLTGTLTQSGVEDDFTAAAPVEIQIAKARTVTQWVRSAAVPVSFSMALKAAPLKVLLDPHCGVLRK
jgi:hypothetical protein